MHPNRGSTCHAWFSTAVRASACEARAPVVAGDVPRRRTDGLRREDKGLPVDGARQARGLRITTRAQANEPSAARADIAENMVEMRVGQYEAQAGARVVQTADKVLGTLIDVTA